MLSSLLLPVSQAPTIPYGVGKSMESANCYGRPPPLGLQLGLENKIDGEKKPATTSGTVASFERGVVYSTKLGGKASTTTLGAGWETMVA